MKIAMIVDNMSIMGGYQKLVLRTSQQLKISGHEVIIYSPSINKQTCYPELWINLKTKSIYKKDNTRKSFIINRVKQFFSYILLACKFNQVNAIIVHDVMSLLMLNFINTKKTKVIWMLNNQLPNYLYKNHHTKNNHQITSTKATMRKLFSIIIKKSTKKVDLITTYDSYNYNLVTENLSNKSIIIYAGADIEKKEILKNKKQEEIKLLSIGVLFKYRRYEDIIKAIHILNKENIKCSLKIVGAYDFALDYLSFLKNTINHFNLVNQVSFCGNINNEEMDALYHQSDAFLFVNNAFTWGISVFEAMSYKLPIIITNNIGAVDLVKNENCVFIVPPKSPQQIAEAIKTIKQKPEVITQMINNYDNVLEKVSWSSFARRMENAINSINKS